MPGLSTLKFFVFVFFFPCFTFLKQITKFHPHLKDGEWSSTSLRDRYLYNSFKILLVQIFSFSFIQLFDYFFILKWTHKYLFYTLSYDPILLCALLWLLLLKALWHRSIVLFLWALPQLFLKYSIMLSKQEENGPPNTTTWVFSTERFN